MGPLGAFSRILYVSSDLFFSPVSNFLVTTLQVFTSSIDENIEFYQYYFNWIFVILMEKLNIIHY